MSLTWVSSTVLRLSISKKGKSRLRRSHLDGPGLRDGAGHCRRRKGKVLELPGIDDAEVEIVWDPPWTQDLISEEGKMELGLI